MIINQILDPDEQKEILVSYRDKKNKPQQVKFIGESRYFKWRDENIGLTVLTVIGLF